MSYNTSNVNILDFTGFKKSLQSIVGSPIYDLKVLAEGDSWFHIGGNTPFFKERNLLDGVNFNNKHTLLVNMALSGNTMARMSDRVNSPDFYEAMNEYDWNFILLSAGGNDLIYALTEDGQYKYKNKTLSIIQKNDNPTSFMDFINQESLDSFKESILTSFNKFISAKRESTRNSNIPIVIHMYDFPTPRNAPAELFYLREGPWIQKALFNNGVPNHSNYWNNISDYIFTALAKTIQSLHGRSNFYVVNTLHTLTRAVEGAKGDSNDWLNEIHPNSGGFQKLAAKINNTILDLPGV